MTLDRSESHDVVIACRFEPERIVIDPDVEVPQLRTVSSWVTTDDVGAVRNTRDIDLLVRRADLPVITTALERAGFVRAEVLDVTVFLDGPDAKPSESIHLLFAGEKVRAEHPLPSPDLSSIDDPAGFRVVALESPVQMKLSGKRPEVDHVTP